MEKKLLCKRNKSLQSLQTKETMYSHWSIWCPKHKFKAQIGIRYQTIIKYINIRNVLPATKGIWVNNTFHRVQVRQIAKVQTILMRVVTRNTTPASIALNGNIECNLWKKNLKIKLQIHYVITSSTKVLPSLIMKPWKVDLQCYKTKQT